MSRVEFLTILLGVIGATLSALQLIIAWKQFKLSKRESKESTQEKLPQNELPAAAVGLLKLTVSSEDEQENIIGDLVEEQSHLQSGAKTRFWLYGQVIRSFFPLAYRRLRSSLSQYRKRIR